jgi:hypothetical protein
MGYLGLKSPAVIKALMKPRLTGTNGGEDREESYSCYSKVRHWVVLSDVHVEN